MSSTSPSDIAALSATTQKAVLGAEIITKTLDTLNQYGGDSGSGSCNKSGTSSDMAASYDFQKSVLSAAYSPKGAIADVSS